MTANTFLPEEYYNPKKSSSVFATLSCHSSSLYYVRTCSLNRVTIKGNVVKIENISSGKIEEIVKHIELLTRIKHSKKSNNSILFDAIPENLIYLKLKNII